MMRKTTRKMTTRTLVKRSLGFGFLLLAGLVAVSLQAAPDVEPILLETGVSESAVEVAGKPLGFAFELPPEGVSASAQSTRPDDPGIPQGKPLGFEYQLPPAQPSVASVIARPLGIEFGVPPTTGS